MKRVAGYVAVSASLIFLNLWVAAQVDLSDLNLFLPGTTIQSGDVNENFERLRQALLDLQDRTGTVVAGTGLEGGGAGAATLAIAPSFRLPQSCANGAVAEWNGSFWLCGTDDVGAGGGGGDVTAVVAGEGLFGGGSSGDVTVAVDFAGSGSATTVARSDHGHQPELPAGAVMSFNSTQCPTGWTPFLPAQGRTVVGLRDGGTLTGTVGAQLADKALPTHSHQVALPKIVTPGCCTHQHEWASLEDGEWVTHNALGNVTSMVDWGDGMDSDGAGFFPVAFENPSNGSKTRFYTQPAGNHSHEVTVAPFPSATVGTGLPYVQLLMCEKD